MPLRPRWQRARCPSGLRRAGLLGPPPLPSEVAEEPAFSSEAAAPPHSLWRASTRSLWHTPHAVGYGLLVGNP